MLRTHTAYTLSGLVSIFQDTSMATKVYMDGQQENLT